MNYNRKNMNSSTVSIRLACATVFLLFSFCWLYFFQSDLLMMAQHVLSDGLTHYNPLVGAVIITIVLYLLQILVFGITRLNKRSHALTYLPSMLLLASISSFSLHGDSELAFSFSLWVPILIIFVWILIVLVARLAQEVENDDDYRLFSRPMWINMLIMSVMIMCVSWIGNTNAVLHYRMAAERSLLEGDTEYALKAGRKSLESDESLLMLRMYALTRQGKLGDCLFNYPVTGTSAHILPTDSSSLFLMYPVDSLYKYIGARPAKPMTPMRYLQLVQHKSSEPDKVVGDYILCGYLIDRQIDLFAKNVGKYYQLNDSLPKHYGEALTLYSHLRGKNIIDYKNAVMDEDFKNLLELEKQYPLMSERKGKVEEQYHDTYWYYYRYQ